MLGDTVLRDTETCRIFSHLNEHEVDVDVAKKILLEGCMFQRRIWTTARDDDVAAARLKNEN